MPSTTEPFKDAQRETWASGDHATLSTLIRSVGERVAAAADGTVHLPHEYLLSGVRP